jgi:hypothetical protein
MSMFKGSGTKAPVKPSGEKSAAQNTAVGSGSRPTTSRIEIEDTSPPTAHGLGSRMVAGALK